MSSVVSMTRESAMNAVRVWARWSAGVAGAAAFVFHPEVADDEGVDVDGGGEKIEELLPAHEDRQGLLSHDRVGALFFFFQAEDGIRDLIVTGVQTCALPI